jgi:hypothetical protein
LLARVSNLVEIHAAFRHMRGDAASGSPVLGSAPDRRRVYCDWSMVKQGCWKSEDQGHHFRYHRTRKLPDVFPSGSHRDAFSLTTCMQLAPDWNREAFTRGNLSSAGRISESRRVSPQNTRVVLPTLEMLTQQMPVWTSPKFSNPNPESTNWYVVGVGICTSKTGQGRIAGKTGTDSW